MLAAREAGGSDRNAEGDQTGSRRRCGADPNPRPQRLPLQTDGDVCGEGVNTPALSMTQRQGSS